MPYKEIGEIRRMRYQSEHSNNTTEASPKADELEPSLLAFLSIVYFQSRRPELAKVADQTLKGSTKVMDLDTATKEIVFDAFDEDDPRSVAAAAQHGFRRM